MAELDIRAFAISLGILWGCAVFLLGILSRFFDWGTKLVETFASLYIGYKPTILGSLIGAVWGFADGAIGGILIAWLYNFFAK